MVSTPGEKKNSKPISEFSKAKKPKIVVFFSVCDSPETCICGQGYDQPYCATWKCGSYHNNDTSNVCSGNGTCTSPGICHCPQYIGANCENWLCDSHYNNDTSNACSGNGTCSSPNICICPLYVGSDCSNWRCGVFLSNDTSNVCSGNGTCNSPGICKCRDDEYYGDDCETWKCFGEFANDTSNVCSGNGTCISPDSCYCPDYLGSECKSWKCFDVFANDTSIVCNGNGTCISPGICNCPDYEGFDCAAWKCFGVFANDTLNTCSYPNGSCVNPNQCHCPTYVGSTCGTWKCFDKHHNDTAVCSTRGPCISPDSCVCGDYLGSNCDVWKCFGVWKNDTVDVCSGNGTCVSPDQCVCPEHVGSDCDNWMCDTYLANDTDVCNGNGTCLKHDDCDCNDGYFGLWCELIVAPICFNQTNPEACSFDNGTCIEDGVCSCPDYRGAACSFWECFGVPANDTRTCSSNGTCVSPDKCVCRAGHYGSNCEVWTCFGFYHNDTTNVCSGNGTCTSPGDCICPSYQGTACQLWSCFGYSANDTENVCNGNGSCVTPGVCYCPEYVGHECTNWRCGAFLSNDTDNVCSMNGTCVSPGECICPTYTGTYCDNWKCGSFLANDTDNVCSNNGTCDSPDVCICPDYEAQDYCANWKCGEYLNGDTAMVCSGNGTCDAPGVCVCPDYIGFDCSLWKCNGYLANDTDSVCSGHGVCVGPSHCICGEYIGDDCGDWKCFDGWKNDTSNVCSGVGTCEFPNVCSCGDYLGSECEVWKCFGVWKNDTVEVCSGNGTCVSPDQCVCPEHVGSECGNWMCFGIIANDSSVCAGKGSCVEFNECKCFDSSEWFAPFCNTTSCDEIISTELNVCSSHGRCSTLDKCDCYDGSIGGNCEYTYDAPIVNVLYDDVVGKCSNIILDASGSTGYDLEYTWSTNLPSFSFESTFAMQVLSTDAVGVFEFSVSARDHWGRISTPFTFFVEKLSFSQPTAVVDVHSTTTSVNPEDVFVLTGYADTGTCDSDTTFEYEWRQIPGSPEIDFGGVDMTAQTLRFANGFPFVETSFVMVFEVTSLLGSSNCTVAVSTIIRDLVAVISDSSKDIPERSLNSIHGLNSFDPENSAEVAEYSWVCTKTPSDACENFTVVGDTVVFVPHFLGEYRIELTFSKDSRVDTSVIVYNVFEVTSPMIYVPSIRVEYTPPIPGPYLINTERVILSGSIDEHEQVPYVTFLWVCDTLPDLEDVILSNDVTSLDLVIAPNVIQENTICTLNAYHDEIHVRAQIDLVFNTPPRFGVINVFPEVNFVFEDFWIEMNNWQDNDAPIMYSLEYNHVITNRTKYVFPYTEKTSFPFQISTQGCAKSNYNIDLIVRIKDYYDSETVEIVPIIVKPSENDALAALLQETIDFLDERVSAGDFRNLGLEKILVVINIITKTICSSMNWQELLCMSVEECEDSDIPQRFPELFAVFQRGTVEYLDTFLNEFTQAQIGSMISVLENLILNDDDLIVNLFSFVSKFLEKFVDEMELNNDFQVLLGIIDRYVLVLSQSSRRESFDVGEEIYNVLQFFFRNFVSRLFVSEKNLYLTNTEHIIFEYVKDYSTNYRENKKLRIEEKVIQIDEEFEVEIPGEVVRAYALSDVISSALIRVPLLDDENSTEFILSVFGAENENIVVFLDDPIQINIKNLEFTENDGINCRHVSAKNSESSACAYKIESLKGACLCNRSSGTYTYSIGNPKIASIPPIGDSSLGITIATVISGLFVFLVLVVVMGLVFVALYVIYKRQRRKIVPRTELMSKSNRIQKWMKHGSSVTPDEPQKPLSKMEVKKDLVLEVEMEDFPLQDGDRIEEDLEPHVNEVKENEDSEVVENEVFTELEPLSSEIPQSVLQYGRKAVGEIEEPEVEVLSMEEGKKDGPKDEALGIRKTTSRDVMAEYSFDYEAKKPKRVSSVRKGVSESFLGLKKKNKKKRNDDMFVGSKYSSEMRRIESMASNIDREYEQMKKLFEGKTKNKNVK